MLLLFFGFCHFRFKKGLLFAVVGGLIFSFDKPFDSHATIVSATPDGIMKVLKIVWNVKKFCDPSSPKYFYQ